MKLPIFQADAFTNRVFAGNPAAVVLMDEWLPDPTLQAIAQENNYSETAFVIPRAEFFDLRWFTPELEVDLCGHATLVSAYVLFRHGYTPHEEIVFQSKSGTLTVRRERDLLAMDFPSRPPCPIHLDDAVSKALGATPCELHESRDLLAVFSSQPEVEELSPDFPAVAKLNTFAVIATAPGTACDFVSRFFAPGAGVPEDPVTGSAHCTLVPYWSARLGKSKLHALQVSRRGGEIYCEHVGERVVLAGRVVEYLRGEIYVE
ncbi:MAG: PhzF family phenazine biosynthesis protein [Planctomycetota bacterium]|jgi:PhzF family phenazine biosynthesis protein